MSYSSQGPSNGGMTVPDLTGPTNTTGFTYSTFTGTSCATPNVAGAACAFWSARPTYSNTAIRWLLYEQAELLKGGKRVAYGARAITEGGYQSVPLNTDDFVVEIVGADLYGTPSIPWASARFFSVSSAATLAMP